MKSSINIFLLAISASVCAGSVHANDALRPIIEDFAKCKAGAAAQRLVCFETTLKIYEQDLALGSTADVSALKSEVTAAAQGDEIAAAATDKEGFGFSSAEREVRELASLNKQEKKQRKKKKREKELLRARILHIVKRGDGRRLIVLENGQAWLGNGDDKLRSLDAGDEIEIEKSRFGGYRLVKAGAVGFLGVRRLD